MEKHIEYAATLLSAVNEVLSNPDSENYIGIEELQDEDNATAFLHALMNMVPTHVYNQLTNGDDDLLGVNAIAVRLIFQYQTK